MIATQPVHTVIQSMPNSASCPNPRVLSFKRAMDVVLAACGLLAAMPVLMVIALLVRMDGKGPILFRQQRGGLNGQPFSIYKFRTMVVTPPTAGVVQATRNDPRLTRTGKWLRNLSLDELPQLVNVLKGDMSLIGPRPHALQHDSYYSELIPTYHQRFRMRPGLTGLAQVKGWRGETDRLEKMQRRVEMDNHYIDHYSLGMDIRILFQTVLVVFFQKNAY
jgi:putative colanic acid biosynthesis UDP-glucose lipid carrier transferase